MKITFINPSMTGRQRSGPMEPLAFAVLKGLTPPEHSVEFFDEAVAPLPDLGGLSSDLVGISAHTFTARRAYQIARDCRARGIPVVMGGYHPTLAPEEAELFADAVVVGEAENVWPQVLQDVASGSLQRRYSAPVADLAGVRFDRSVFDGIRYGPVRIVQFGRGCRYNCEFCSIPKFFGACRTAQRPVAEVAEEVRRMPRGHLFWADDNLWVNNDAFTELMQALIPLKRRWSCQATIDVADDPARLALMKRAGCYSILIGFESTEVGTLGRMRKRWNRGPDRYGEVVRRLDDHGILCYATFLFGYEEGLTEAFEACRRFCQDSKMFLVAFNMLTPLPNTPIHDRLKNEGRLVQEPWWLHPDTRFGYPPFLPRGMTRDELAAQVDRIRSDFYSPGSIVRRAFHTSHLLRSPVGLAFYLLVNFKYRAELKRMVMTRFGAPWDRASLAPARTHRAMAPRGGHS